jgi:hypothetical protein
MDLPAALFASKDIVLAAPVLREYAAPFAGDDQVTASLL